MAFREDFTYVDMTLVAVLNESNEAGDAGQKEREYASDLQRPEDADAASPGNAGCTNFTDFEARDAATYNFLKEISSRFAASSNTERNRYFDRVFLLSNKNEHGEVRIRNFENICETIAGLPLLNTTDSRFSEILAARAHEEGRVLFASAGCWLKPPSRVAENIEMHRLAEEMQREIEYSEKTTPGGEFPANRAGFDVFPGPEEIVENIASVAAKPLRFRHLWGYTIKEAENILYGDAVANFFEKNYARAFSGESEHPANSENMPLSEVAARERFLREAVSKAEILVRDIQADIEQTYAMQCPKNPFLGIDYVKTVIGENYARLFEARRLQAEIAKKTAEHTHCTARLESARIQIEELKALPIIDENEKSATEAFALLTTRAETIAHIAISLLRDDGLLRETQALTDASGEPCILRLIGGFTVKDLTRWGAG